MDDKIPANKSIGKIHIRSFTLNVLSVQLQLIIVSHSNINNLFSLGTNNFKRINPSLRRHYGPVLLSCECSLPSSDLLDQSSHQYCCDFFFQTSIPVRSVASVGQTDTGVESDQALSLSPEYYRLSVTLLSARAGLWIRS